MVRFAQSHGLFALVRALLEGAPLDIPAICAILERGERTARRTLASLRAVGLPIEEEVADAQTGRKRYQLPRQWGSGTLSLDGLDALALSFLLARGRPQRGEPFSADVARLEDKLRAALGPRWSSRYDELADVLLARPLSGPRREGPDDLVEELMEAARLRRVCEVLYVRADGAERRYPLHPLALFSRRDRLYLAAYVPHNGRVQSYAVSRFREVVRTARRFAPPADFDPQAFVEAPFGVLHDGVRRVRVRVDPVLARHATERRWHASQATLALPDGSVELTWEAEGSSEIVAWVLYRGEHAELLEPPELRAEVARRLRAAARRYGPAGADDPGDEEADR